MAYYREDGAFVSKDQAAWAPQRESTTGRQIRLSERAKAFVSSHVETAFWQSVREIDRYAACVIEMMRSCTNPSRFKNTLVTWMSLYSQVKSAEVDLNKNLDPERLSSIKPDIIRVHERCLDLRKKAYQHLDLLQLDLQEELERKSRHDVSKGRESSNKTPSMFSSASDVSSKSTSSRKKGKSHSRRKSEVEKKTKALSPEQKERLDEKSKKYEKSMKEQIMAMEDELVNLTNSLRERARSLVQQTLREEQQKGLSPVVEEGEETEQKTDSTRDPVIDGTKPKRVIRKLTPPVVQNLMHERRKESLASVNMTPEPIAMSTLQKSKQRPQEAENQYQPGNYYSPEKSKTLPKYVGVRPNSPKNLQIKNPVSPRKVSVNEISKAEKRKEKKVRRLVKETKTVKKTLHKSPPKVSRLPHTPYDRRLFTPPMDSFQKEFQEFLRWKEMKDEFMKSGHQERFQEESKVNYEACSEAGETPGGRYDESLRHEDQEQKVYETPTERSSRYSSRSSSSVGSSESKASEMFTQAIGALTDALLKQQEHNNDKILLPKVEPKVYSGNVLSFHIWLNSFQTLIEPKISCPVRRLLYLGTYVSGDAEKAIKPLLDMPSEPDSYDKAIEKLKERFGCRIKIAEEFKRKLKKWPAIKEGDFKQLQEYADFLGHCQTAMKSVGYLNILAQPEENRRLTEKLPVFIAARWNREVVKYMKAEENKKDSSPYPPFSKFCDFLQHEASVAAGPCAPSQDRYNSTKKTSLNTDTSETKTDAVRSGPRRNNKKKFRKKERFADKADKKDDRETEKSAEGQNISKSVDNDTCYMCKSSSHMIEKCPSFLNCTPQERREYLKQHVICFGCLRTNHDFRFCKERYNPLLRIVNPVTVNNAQVKDDTSSTGTSQDNVISHSIHQSCDTVSPQYYSTIVPIKIAHVNKPSQSCLIYALVDTQSNGTFITEEVLRKLGVEGTPTDLNLLTMNTKSVVPSSSINGLMVSAFNSDEFHFLPTSFSKDKIPCDRKSIAQKSILKHYSHMEEVLPELMDYDPAIPVGALLGYNFPSGFRPCTDHSTVIGPPNSPWAVKTALGWSVAGPVGGEVDEAPARYCFTTQVQETSISTLRKAFDLEFLGPDTAETKSYEDTLFLRKMEEGFRIDQDGHVELPLPLREDASVPSSGSRKVAYRRLMSQRKKFLANPGIFKQYDDFINNMLTQHHAEDAPALTDEDVLAYWLPHQYVFHPRKLDEIRVVFDGSSEADGVSLNDLLLPGPDMVNNLIGVLVRFREGKEAFLCDIQGMFHQVRVTEKFRNMLRFFWFANGDPNGPIVEYRVCVHLFGATSSPACATYALRKVADLYKNMFGIDVVNFIKKFFYVDDGLRSVDQVDRALKIIFGAIDLCGLGGFRLHKFACNNPEILQQIPVDYRSKDLQDWSAGERLPNQMCLGSHWSMHLDCFLYIIKSQEVSPTRRGMLSFVGSLFDPQGFISPVTLYGRKILQALCKDKFTWDQSVPDDILSLWNEWYLSLKILETLKIPRCFKKNIQDVELVELHMYSDAAEDGYGACGYLVLQDDLQRRDITLTLAKSRVKPLKTITMPRLELQAAVLSVKMAEFLLQELPFENVKVYFWCDSMIVLAYIINDHKRFRIYIANRVQYIRDRSSPEQWNYIDSASNPADLASRGCKADDIVGNELWFQGPETLKLPQMKIEQNYDLPDNDPEILREKIVYSTILEDYSISLCLSDVSSWSRMIRIMNTMRSGILQWYRFICKKKGRTCKLPEEDAVQRRHKAKMCIVRHVQKECFPIEMTRILPGYPDTLKLCKARRKAISSEGQNLRKLDVFMCKTDGVLKVGGRIRRADLPINQVHPYILPQRHPITNSIVRFHHEIAAHAGRSSTINLLRTAGWWVIHVRSSVEYNLKRCITCKKLRGKIAEQKMSDLPIDRLEEAPPFTYCAVDLFGPFYIKEKRTIKKRWGCLFCCLIIRAVHVEICDDMTTDSFLLAYRRFVNRRGPIRTIRCDRGSNIMGARGDLELTFSKLDDARIRAHMLEDDCDWINMIPNPPKSSHMGGVWERLIGSVRRSLEGLLVQHPEHLSDEGLKTLATEAESIVNSRPLTYVDVSDPNEPMALTPSTLLTMKTKRLMAPFGEFKKEDKYSKRRWKAVQYLATQFWERWKKEFLPLITQRPKWQNIHFDIQEDDIVLLVEDSQPRSSWPLARVVQVKRSIDGKVRSLSVKTKNGIYERPIRKIVFLYRKDDA